MTLLLWIAIVLVMAVGAWSLNTLVFSSKKSSPFDKVVAFTCLIVLVILATYIVTSTANESGVGAVQHIPHF